MKEISVVIPVFNSENCLDQLYSELERSVSVAHEVIFINDRMAAGL